GVCHLPPQAPGLQRQGPNDEGVRADRPSSLPSWNPDRARRALERDSGCDRRRTGLRPRPALSKELEDEFLSPLSDEERANLHALLYRLAEKHDPRCANMSAPVS